MPDYGEYTIGFELEYDDADLEDAQNLLSGYGYVHEDGTVNGFELSSNVFAGAQFLSCADVTHFQKMFDIIVSLGSTPDSEDGAGQHIHIGKEFFTFESTFAINCFFVNYDEFLKKIGERNFTTYCLNKMNSFNSTYKTYSGDKYRTFHVELENTNEFRFFNSTTKLDTFLKNMQFALAITAFTAEDKIKGEHCKKDDPAPLIAFQDWVKGHAHHFGHLLNYIKQADIVPAKVIPKPAYKLNPPSSHSERFWLICNTARTTILGDSSVIPIQTFASISERFVSKRVDMALSNYLELQLVLAKSQGFTDFELPERPREDNGLLNALTQNRATLFNRGSW